MRKTVCTLLFLACALLAQSQTRVSLPADILSSALSHDESLLAATTPDSVYIIETDGLQVRRKWKHGLPFPAVLGFHPTNNQVLLLQAQHARDLSYLNLSPKLSVQRYHDEKQWRETPEDSITLWDIGKAEVANKATGSFFMQFGTDSLQFVGVLNSSFAYDYQGEQRYAPTGAELMTQGKDFQFTSQTRNACRRLLLSPTQRHFAAAWLNRYDTTGTSYSFTIHDTKTHAKVYELVGLEVLPVDFSFSRDGKFLALSVQKKLMEREEEIRIIDVAAGTVVQTLPAGVAVRTLHFSDDGKQLFYRNEEEWITWDRARQVITHRMAYSYKLDVQPLRGGKQVLLLGDERWPAPGEPVYAVRKEGAADVEVFSKTIEATATAAFADSTRFTMVLNDFPQTNDSRQLSFSTDRRWVSIATENNLQYWNTALRKKVLQKSFEKAIRAVPDRAGKHLLVVEQKSQPNAYDYVLHRVQLSNSTVHTVPGPTGYNAPGLAASYFQGIADATRDGSWFGVDGSETVWQVEAGNLSTKAVATLPGLQLRLVQQKGSTLYVYGEKEGAYEAWSLAPGGDKKLVARSATRDRMQVVGNEAWLWNDYSKDSTIEVWKDNRLVKTLTFPGKVEQVDADSGKDNALVQFDAKGREHIQRFTGTQAQPAHNTGTIGARFYLLGPDELLGNDLVGDHKGMSTWYQNGSLSVPWSLKAVQILEGNNFDVSANGQYVVVNQHVLNLGEVEQWDLDKFAPVALVRDTPALQWVEIFSESGYGPQPAGFTLVLKDRTRGVVKKSKTWVPVPDGELFVRYNHNQVLLSPDRRWAYTYTLPGLLNQNDRKAAPVLWNLATMEGTALPIKPEDAAGVAFTPDSKGLLASRGGFGSDYNWSGEEARYSLAPFKLVETKKISSLNNRGVLRGETFRVGSSGWNNVDWLVPQGDGFSVRKTFHAREWLEGVVYSAPHQKVVAGSKGGSLYIWDREGSASPLAILPVHNAEVKHMKLRGDRLYTLSANGEVAVTDIKTHRVLLQVYTLEKDGQLRSVMSTPGGHFQADPDLLGQVHFVKNGEVYPLSTFELEGNRPDKVLQAVGLADTAYLAVLQRSWQMRVRRAGLDPDQPLATTHRPVVAWDRRGLPAVTQDSAVRLQLTVSDGQAPLRSVLVRVNGVPLTGKKGIALTGEQRSATLEPVVPLNTGRNYISVVALNDRGVESREEAYELYYSPKEARAPRLVYIGIGVSQYADSVHNLTYAAADVALISERLRLHFKTSERHALLNGAATRDNIVQLKEHLKNTHVDDMVVISFSGHGVVQEGKGFFFAPHDMDFRQPDARGVSMAMIEDLMDDVPARKRLLLIDACHSGEELPDGGGGALPEGVKARGGILLPKKGAAKGNARSSYLLMKELFTDFGNGNGTFIISAAAGNELAFEGKDWKSGVFTKSFLDALQALRYPQESSRDKSVKVRDLRQLIYRQVSQLTGGRQNPTSRQENGWWNWSLFEE